MIDQRRWFIGIVAVIAGMAAVIGLIAFVDLYSSNPCTPSLSASQWPKFLGCAMARRETLSGSLIAAAAALIAGLLAFWSVQIPIRNAARQKTLAQSDAKLVAVVSITQPVHAAAAALRHLKQMLDAGAANSALAAKSLETAISYVEQAVRGSLVRTIIPDLGTNERLLVTMILERLQTFITTARDPGPFLSPEERLKRHIAVLSGIRKSLGALDEELVNVFDRDSTWPPSS